MAKHAPRVNRARDRACDDGALAALARYAWPGNVRELENVIEQSLVFAEGSELDEADLPAHLQSGACAPRDRLGRCPCPAASGPCPTSSRTWSASSSSAPTRRPSGVKTETARLLGIKTSALYYKLEKYGFIPKGERPEES